MRFELSDVTEVMRLNFVVTPSGFEPLASRLGILRSILLSYGAGLNRYIDCRAGKVGYFN